MSVNKNINSSIAAEKYYFRTQVRKENIPTKKSNHIKEHFDQKNVSACDTQVKI
jgi:hypothetical protein